MSVDYVILRPKRKDQVREEFRIVLRKEIKATQHKKLGLYDPKNGKFPQLVKTSAQFLKDMGYDKGAKIVDLLNADKGKLVLDNKNLKKRICCLYSLNSMAKK